ncbi:No apical meristem (NAM) protein [Corchorus olitorius]|uniref:No apical meristem (NAM) protein n=1 Tax=Corchorus olitorius TaxID=93759 RepID=A0A1R3I6A8_9ROSI|nr:No apical meristem (NAM) protein [Corchorus olitorius]
MSSVPPGFRFKPAADEIFKYYLCPAMKGEAFPLGILRECDLYEREPWHLFDKDPSQSFWVLTPLKRMSENKIQRTAGSGVWNGRGTVKKVRDSDGKVGLNDPVLAVCEITYKPKPPSSSSHPPPCVKAAVEAEPEIFNNNLNSDRKRDRLSSVSVDDPTPNPLKKPRLDQNIAAALLASNGPKSNLLPNFLKSNLLPNSKLLLATLVLMITFMLLAPTNSNPNLRLQNLLSQLRRSLIGMSFQLIGMSFQLLKQCQWITLMNAISFHLDLTIWWKTKAMHFKPSSTNPSTMS